MINTLKEILLIICLLIVFCVKSSEMNRNVYRVSEQRNKKCSPTVSAVLLDCSLKDSIDEKNIMVNIHVSPSLDLEKDEKFLVVDELYDAKRKSRAKIMSPYVIELSRSEPIEMFPLEFKKDIKCKNCEKNMKNIQKSVGVKNKKCGTANLVNEFEKEKIDKDLMTFLQTMDNDNLSGETKSEEAVDRVFLNNNDEESIKYDPDYVTNDFHKCRLTIHKSNNNNNYNNDARKKIEQNVSPHDRYEGDNYNNQRNNYETPYQGYVVSEVPSYFLNGKKDKMKYFVKNNNDNDRIENIILNSKTSDDYTNSYDDNIAGSSNYNINNSYNRYDDDENNNEYRQFYNGSYNRYDGNENNNDYRQFYNGSYNRNYKNDNDYRQFYNGSYNRNYGNKNDNDYRQFYNGSYNHNYGNENNNKNYRNNHDYNKFHEKPSYRSYKLKNQNNKDYDEDIDEKLFKELDNLQREMAEETVNDIDLIDSNVLITPKLDKKLAKRKNNSKKLSIRSQHPFKPKMKHSNLNRNSKQKFQHKKYHDDAINNSYLKAINNIEKSDYIDEPVALRRKSKPKTKVHLTYKSRLTPNKIQLTSSKVLTLAEGLKKYREKSENLFGNDNFNNDYTASDEKHQKNIEKLNNIIQENKIQALEHLGNTLLRNPNELSGRNHMFKEVFPKQSHLDDDYDSENLDYNSHETRSFSNGDSVQIKRSDPVLNTYYISNGLYGAVETPKQYQIPNNEKNNRNRQNEYETEPEDDRYDKKSEKSNTIPEEQNSYMENTENLDMNNIMNQNFDNLPKRDKRSNKRYRKARDFTSNDDSEITDFLGVLKAELPSYNGWPASYKDSRIHKLLSSNYGSSKQMSKLDDANQSNDASRTNQTSENSKPEESNNSTGLNEPNSSNKNSSNDQTIPQNKTDKSNQYVFSSFSALEYEPVDVRNTNELNEQKYLEPFNTIIEDPHLNTNDKINILNMLEEHSSDINNNNNNIENEILNEEKTLPDTDTVTKTKRNYKMLYDDFEEIKNLKNDEENLNFYGVQDDNDNANLLKNKIDVKKDLKVSCKSCGGKSQGGKPTVHSLDNSYYCELCSAARNEQHARPSHGYNDINVCEKCSKDGLSSCLCSKRWMDDNKDLQFKYQDDLNNRQSRSVSDIWYSVYNMSAPLQFLTTKIQIFRKKGDTWWKIVPSITLTSMSGVYVNKDLSIIFSSHVDVMQSNKPFDLLQNQMLLVANNQSEKIPKTNGNNLLAITEDKFYKYNQIMENDQGICDAATETLLNMNNNFRQKKHINNNNKNNKSDGIYKEETGLYSVKDLGSFPTTMNILEKCKTNPNHLCLNLLDVQVPAYKIKIKLPFRENKLIPNEGDGKIRISSVIADATTWGVLKVTTTLINEGVRAAEFAVDIENGPTICSSFSNVVQQFLFPHISETIIFLLPLENNKPKKYKANVVVKSSTNKTVAIRQMLIEPSARCFCVWNCNCYCIQNLASMVDVDICKMMDTTDGIESGFIEATNEIDKLSYKSSSHSINETMFFGVLSIFSLALMCGLLKAIIGIKCLSTNKFGYNYIQPMNKYDCVTKRRRFLINTIFFLIIPFIFCCKCFVPKDDDADNCHNNITDKWEYSLLQEEFDERNFDDDNDNDNVGNNNNNKYLSNNKRRKNQNCGNDYFEYDDDENYDYAKRKYRHSSGGDLDDINDDGETTILSQHIEILSDSKRRQRSTIFDSTTNDEDVDDTGYEMNNVIKRGISLQRMTIGHSSEEINENEPRTIEAVKLVRNLIASKFVYRTLNQSFGDVIVPDNQSYSVRGYFVPGLGPGYIFFTSVPLFQHYLICPDTHCLQGISPPLQLKSKSFTRNYKNRLDVLHTNDLSVSPSIDTPCINVLTQTQDMYTMTAASLSTTRTSS